MENENKNVFFRVDLNGDEIAVDQQEIEQAAEKFIDGLDDKEDEFLPPPPAEIAFNWDSLK